MPTNYWIAKSEPDAYSIDDLERDGKEPWTGVRNYQVRNYMRDSMKVGDKVLYYHSSVKPAGVVGIAEVVSTPYPDPTSFDASSEYYDEGTTPDNPRWILVDFGFVEKFKRMVTLDQMKADPALEGMLVLRKGNRLSILPVSEEHFAHIVMLGRA